jgi:hypothetical protein
LPEIASNYRRQQFGGISQGGIEPQPNGLLKGEPRKMQGKPVVYLAFSVVSLPA